MLIFLVVLLTVLPMIELAVLIQFNAFLSSLVGPVLGLTGTIALTIGKAAIGGWLARQQGMKTLGAIQDAMAHGQLPADELFDGALILVGGVMLLTPGLITDTVGLTLLFPPTRAKYKAYLRRWVQHQFEQGRVFARANAASFFTGGLFKPADRARGISPDDRPSA